MSTANAAPPRAQEKPKTHTLHGDQRPDPYYWLNNPKDADVINYLKAENAYTESQMESTKPLQKQLYQELVSYMIETDQSVPFQKDNYFYYTRQEKGKNYPIYCRKKGSLEAPEEIILNQNELAKGKEYHSIGIFEVSPDHRYLAYSVDDSGAESYTLFIKDLESGQLLPDKIEKVYYSAEWANDSNTLFYNVIDKAHRPYRVHRHTLGSDPAQDPLVYEERDEKFFLDIDKTSSKQYILLHSQSSTTSEVRYINADHPDSSANLLQARKNGRLYNVSHQGNHFYIHTNDKTINFALLKAPVSHPTDENWQVVVPEKKGAKLEIAKVFQDYIALVYRTNASQEIWVYSLKDQSLKQVSVPEEVATIWPKSEQNFKGNQLRFNYASMLTPWSVFDYDFATATLSLKKKDQVPAYDSTRYEMKRVYAPAADGTLVPITLIHRRGLELNGKNPTYLYSYGAYGISTDADFSSSRLPLLERGFVYALAHIRGGEDMGREWYLDGKLLKKKNTFSDFVACAEYLIHENYTSSEHLAIEGGSAGGLLMGAVTNMRPDLFKTVIADVPFVDALTTMLDPSLPLTVNEYEEWGNPEEKVYYDYMKTYSPYDNIKKTNYPNMLILGGLNDPRVGYWEPAKFAARLRTHKTDQNLLLLKTHMSAGHSGSSGRYDYLKEIAFSYAFILKTLGLAQDGQ